MRPFRNPRLPIVVEHELDPARGAGRVQAVLESLLEECVQEHEDLNARLKTDLLDAHIQRDSITYEKLLDLRTKLLGMRNNVARVCARSMPYEPATKISKANPVAASAALNER